MARLPILHKRPRSRRQRAFDTAQGAAKAIVATKVISGSSRAAGKAYGKARGRRPLVRLLMLPVAVAGGVVAWRKFGPSHNGSESDDQRADLGTVASASSVSPKVSAAPTVADETT